MNKYKEHVHIIPEDDANRQIANGFVAHHQVKDPPVKVMPPAGGWGEVKDTLENEYVSTLQSNPWAHVVLLIDFDGNTDHRRHLFEEVTPEGIKPRVFLLGSRNDPETLRQSLRMTFSQIGLALANECADGTTTFWHHEQLAHNDADRERLIATVRPFLF